MQSLRLPFNEIEGADHNGVRSHQCPLPIYALVEGRSVTKSILTCPFVNLHSEIEGTAHSGPRSTSVPFFFSILTTEVPVNHLFQYHGIQ
jgi:hypothetical protein